MQPAVGPAQEPGAAWAEAGAAGLRYVTDSVPGIRRIATARGFDYRTPGGACVRDEARLRRIQALAIPPAWTEVWICPDERGHIQATGRDARRRKQYRYHALWRELRDEAKFGRTLAFGCALPRIRRRVARDLARPGLPREKALAVIVRLLELSAIRIGNDAYARSNGSYGLTTLRNRHVAVNGSEIAFRFRAKSGRPVRMALRDRRLARIVRRCQDLPGQELFQYLDDEGAVRDVRSDDVNRYIEEIAGASFTAKDFRTWTGTVLAAAAFREIQRTDGAATKRNVRRAIDAVARRLGNTPAICRKCYVHPAVIEAFLDGAVDGSIRRGGGPRGLTAEECAALRLLERPDGGRRGGRPPVGRAPA